jgi:hypothetical protein
MELEAQLSEVVSRLPAFPLRAVLRPHSTPTLHTESV